MGIKLTDHAKRLIDGKNFAFLATLLPDGSPHVTPMWVDREGDVVRFNTAVGRVKQKNISRDQRVSVSVADHENPYDRVVIHGRVITQVAEGADEHIDRLAKKYTGADKYQRDRPDEKRITIRVEPFKIA